MCINMKKLFAIFLIFCFTSVAALAQSSDAVSLADEYYRMGDFEKAQAEYKKLARNRKNIPRIHDNYFKLLLTVQAYDDAEKYMKGVMRQNPNNFIYDVDYGLLFQAKNEQKKADKVFDDIITKVAKDAKTKNQSNPIRILAQTFFSNSLREQALKAYGEGRKALGKPELFSLELANAYRLMNQKQPMIKEYLTFAKYQPQNLNYVKNSFQRVLIEAEDLDTLEIILYDNIQTDGGNPIYNEVLVWTHLQQKNFVAALRQARALDLRTQNKGENIVNVGMIAYRNSDYKSAQKAFNYIINEFKESPSLNLAMKYSLLAEEEVVKTTYPIDSAAVKALIVKYDDFRQNSRDVFTVLDAQRRVALLYAFQLGEIPKSIEVLNDLVKQPIGKHQVMAQAKMDLADIYLLNEEPWESILLYAQVEKMFKDERLGYTAKLKSAKLSYFKGEFELAQGHLDILKLATSREIANDALDLSILIKNNTVFDSTDVVMKEYANIELLLFQNQTGQAMQAMDSMLVRYPNHSILDEVHYLKAETSRKLGDFDGALYSLNKINEGFYFEILGDDALFMTALIHEEDLQDKEKAMELYTELLKKFPGSIYVAESRNRFRELRGDF
jgi:tetratricopeptide (TPR) repeat protein